MKGVLLAGGLGTRLLPMTKVTNKHLLPIYDRPMVYYPLQQFVACGIEDVLVVTGDGSASDFLELLGNGQQFGLKHLSYKYQDGHGGIAHALSLARDFSEGEPIMVLLGDNIFQDSLIEAIRIYSAEEGAMIVLKEVDDPERFGVVVLEDGRPVKIIEKPSTPPSRLAVTGCYFFDSGVFDIIRGLKPSSRGELEITDVNNAYIDRYEMTCHILDGWWTDAGTILSMFQANRLVAQDRDNPVLIGSVSGQPQPNQGPSK